MVITFGPVSIRQPPPLSTARERGGLADLGSIGSLVFSSLSARFVGFKNSFALLKVCVGLFVCELRSASIMQWDSVNSRVLHNVAPFSQRQDGSGWALTFTNGVTVWVPLVAFEQPPRVFEAYMDAILTQIVQLESANIAPPHQPSPPETFGTYTIFAGRMKGEFPACSICLDDFKPREKIRTLHTKNCSFHNRCLRKWFKHHNTCPNCRQPCG